MATWKEARALEAAARLAESQRQREMAKGQREQRTTEQILGLVEGLIGAAPQAASAFEQSQAERVLAGERPLEMPEAEDPLTSLGRFLFEPGIQRKAKQMAQERAPAEVAKLQPLTGKAVQERIAAGDRPLDRPEERKQIGLQEYEKRLSQSLPVEASAMGVLEQSPAVQLLPERERQALALGETQRVQAEQAAAEAAAAEREVELGLKKAKTKEAEAKAGSYAAKLEKEGRQVDPKATLLQAEIDPIFENYKQQLNITGDPVAVNQAKQQIREQVYAVAEKLGMDTDTTEGLAAIERVFAQKIKDSRLDAYGPKDYEKVNTSIKLYDDITEIDRLRKETEFSPDDLTILKQELDALQAPFNLDTWEKTNRAIDLRKRFSEKGQWLYVKKALAMKNTLMKIENDGYNVTNMDATRLSNVVLNPFVENELWDAEVQSIKRDVAKDAKIKFAELSGVFQAPAYLSKRVSEIEIPERYDATQLAGMQAMDVSTSDVIADFAADVGFGTANLVMAIAQQMSGKAPEQISKTLSTMGIDVSPEKIKQIIPSLSVSRPKPAKPQAAPATPVALPQGAVKFTGSPSPIPGDVPEGSVQVRVTSPGTGELYYVMTLDEFAKRKEMAASSGGLVKVEAVQ